MKQLTTLSVSVLVFFAVNCFGEKGLENVEKFIQEEIDGTHGKLVTNKSMREKLFDKSCLIFSIVPVKRSNLQEIPAIGSFHQQENKEPSGKPDKISVTIYKEYKVQNPGGGTEYVSLSENDGGTPILNTFHLNYFLEWDLD